MVQALTPVAEWTKTTEATVMQWIADNLSEEVAADSWYLKMRDVMEEEIHVACLEKFRAIDIDAELSSDSAPTTSNDDLDKAAIGVASMEGFLRMLQQYAVHTLTGPVARELSALTGRVVDIAMRAFDNMAGLIPIWGAIAGALGTMATDLALQETSWLRLRAFDNAVDGFFKDGIAFIKDPKNNIDIGAETDVTVQMTGPFNSVIQNTVTVAQDLMNINGAAIVERCASALGSVRKTLAVKDPQSQLTTQ